MLSWGEAMTTANDEATHGARGAEDQILPSYEAPRITWEESYEPVGLAVSCNHTQGDPACFPGPLGT